MVSVNCKTEFGVRVERVKWLRGDVSVRAWMILASTVGRVTFALLHCRFRLEFLLLDFTLALSSSDILNAR